MSNSNKDYFTEMMKLLAGLGLVAVVLVFVIRMIAGSFSSDAVNTDEAYQQAVNERLQSIETVAVVGGAKPAVKAKAAPKAAPAPKAPEAAPAPKVADASTSDAGGGAELYQAKCNACHGPATAAALGAPAFGDKKAWAPRIAKGMDALMDTALNGSKINPAMLPKGGAFDLSDAQIRSIVEHMVNSAK